MLRSLRNPSTFGPSCLDIQTFRFASVCILNVHPMRALHQAHQCHVPGNINIISTLQFDGMIPIQRSHGKITHKILDMRHLLNISSMTVCKYVYMAAAQNVRSGSSPVPTHDPDLRSRPPIQTFRKDLIQTLDPDLWNDIMYWWVDAWSSDGCMLLGFLLCSHSPCQAAKQQTVVKPRCQAAKLILLQVVRPACQAAKLHTCCLHTLSSFSCHAASKLQHTQTCESTSGPIQTRIQTDPDPIQTTTTTSSDPDHIQLHVKTCDCLVSFLASNSWFTIHQLWNSFPCDL